MRPLGFRHVMAVIVFFMHLPVAIGVSIWIREGLEQARAMLGGAGQREIAAG